MLKKFLIIGLGGSGGKTLRYLKQNLQQKLTNTGWTEGIPTGWQLLHIDTPTQQDTPTLPGNPKLLNPDEYLPLATTGIQLDDIIENLQTKNQNFDGWYINPHTTNIPITMGAGQYRAVGRTIGLYHTNRIQTQLQNKQKTLTTAGATAQLHRLTTTLHPNQTTTDHNTPPTVIIITSLAGGTGSGLLTDICDLLRTNGEPWLDESIGILYSADIFTELSTAATAGIQPNTAAAIAELLHGYYADGGFTPPNNGPIQQRSGPAYPYIIGHTNTKGVTFGDQTGTYRFTAQCLTAILTNPQIQNDFTVHMTANWRSSAGKYPTKPEPWLLPAPHYRGALQALGYTEITLGTHNLKTYAQQRITRDAVEWTLNAHNQLAKNHPQLKNSTQTQIINHLADQHLPQYLQKTELTETQILKNTQIPPTKTQNHYNQLTNQIHETARNRYGTKTDTKTWTKYITEETQAHQATTLNTLHNQLQTQLQKWIKTTPQKILEQTAHTLTQHGAHTTIKTLQKTLQTLKHTQQQIQNQHQNQPTPNLHKTITETLGTRRGKLHTDNENIQNTIQTAIQTTIANQHNKTHLQLTATLIHNLRHGIIQPLITELQNNLDTLTENTQKPEGHPNSTTVKNWPRHHPKSDQNVPDHLQPGPTTKHIINTQKYPQLFNQLTTQTTGHTTTHDAYQTARNNAITGKNNTWIQQNTTWGTKEHITPNQHIPPTNYTINLQRHHIQQNTNQWLTQPGTPWNNYLTQSIRTYLSDQHPPNTRHRREQQFTQTLRTAFETAEPLTTVNPTTLPQIHPNTELNTRPYTSPIPVAGLPIEQTIKQILTEHYQTTQDNPEEELQKTLNQSETETTIHLYTSLGAALHPMVFDSLTKPIAQAWEQARKHTLLTSFWEARRSRPLWAATPIPRPTLQAIIRGWIVGRLLNLITTQNDQITLQTENGPIHHQTMLPTPNTTSITYLATLLEALPLAIPVAVQQNQPHKYLQPYTTLTQWGTEPDQPHNPTFRTPSPILQHWIETGQTPGPNPPTIQEPTQTQRTQAATKLLQQQITLYEQLTETARQQDTTPTNAWLGITHLTHRALNEITQALQTKNTHTPLL